MSRAYMLITLEWMAAHGRDIADGWSRNLVAAEANPADDPAADLNLLAQRRNESDAAVQAVNLVRKFIEQLPDGADPIEALTRALMPAQTDPESAAGTGSESTQVEQRVPVRMAPDEVAAVLADMAARVQAGDSFDGSISYHTDYDHDGEGHVFDVTAVYRVGNRMGQGGTRIIEGLRD